MRIEVYPNVFYDVDESNPLIEVLNERLPKKEQYWKRQTDFPNYFYDYDPHLPERHVCRINSTRTEYKSGKLKSLSVEDTIELVRLVKREADRIRYGIFIWVDGEKLYFPGPYYGALQWGKMFGVKDNDGYGQHREYQQLFACKREFTIVNDYMEGYYNHKCKKSGITQLVSLFIAMEEITYKQFTAAAMSKSHDTAKKANFKYFLYCIKNLPPVLRPKTEQRNYTNAAQRIDFKYPDAEFSMENTFAAVPTTKDGLDGLPPTQRIHIDEPPKLPPSVDIQEVYTKSKEQTKIQQTKVGIIEMTSYPPEEDTPAFKWCKKFWGECCKVGENGLPINKMLPIFIGVVEASNGTFNIYGKPDKFKALKEEQAARALCKTPYELQARKRQYPITAKEGWESGGSGSVYNNIALAEQGAILEDNYKFGALNYIEGNLEWTAGRFVSPVRFVPLTHNDIMNGKTGKWKFYCTLQYLEENTNLCFKMPRKKKIIKKEIVELLQPPDYKIHAAGTDPVDYSYVSEMGEKQSQNASVVKDISGNLISVYWYRGEDPDEALEDFCMEMIFLGTYSLVEGNRKNAITTLEKMGMYYFLLIRHPNGEIIPYSQSVNIKHISSSKDVKAKYIELIMKRIANNIGQFQSLPIIEQHKDFEADDTQKYDLSVADGLAEIALSSMQTWVMSKKTRSDRYKHLGVAVSHLM